VSGDSGYPDKILLEEPEEENPTAYALLSEIKDPYYSHKESSDYAEDLSISQEEMKSNIEVYKNFYAYPKKSESLSKLLIEQIGSITTKLQDQTTTNPSPYLKLRQRTNQEPKRYSSARAIAKNNNYNVSHSQELSSQCSKFDRSYSSASPPGLGYYENLFPFNYNLPYSSYVPNALPQPFPQNDPTSSYAIQGYYPMYVNYQGYPPETGHYTPPMHPVSMSPTNKNNLLKPSKGRPHKSLFAKKEQTHADQDEERITEIIENFDKESDIEALKGEITELAKTQTGSRFLQRQLTKLSPSFVTFILEEVILLYTHRLKSPYLI
jgi:hypothetical protein